jgi:hypothetical protein
VAPTLKVDVPNVRAGADTIDGAQADVRKIPAPACDAAVAGLPGFATANVLDSASEAIRESLLVTVVRYGQVAGSIRSAAVAYERADNVGSGGPSLTERVGQQLSPFTGGLNPTLL